MGPLTPKQNPLANAPSIHLNLYSQLFTKGMKQATRQAIATKLGDVPLDWEEGEVIAS